MPAGFRTPLNAPNPLAALESGNRQTGTSNSYDFPRDELLGIDHWVSFTAFETVQYSRRDFTSRQRDTFRLPLPGNLGTAYNIDYAEKNLGAIGDFVTGVLAGNGGDQALAGQLLTGALIGAAAGGIATGTGGGASAGASTGALGMVLGGGAMDVLAGRDPNTLSRAGGIIASEVLNNDIGSAILGNMGVARNPHRVVLFEGVNYRQHEFSYRFTPKSYEEASQLRDIIKQFKYYSAPSYGVGTTADLSAVPGINQINGGRINLNDTGRHFFKYPEYWKIEFHHKNFLFSIGPSVITGINVQYYPETNVPSFARSQGRDPTPTQIGLSIHFKETELVTKENVTDGR